jgi:16S rRNA processing protein RimM
MAESKRQQKGYITLARIGRPRGVQGEFLIWLFADHQDRLADVKKVYLVLREKRLITELESFRTVSGKTAIKVRGIDAPEQARLWTSGFLEIDEAERVSLPAGVYFQDDIIGLKVMLESGETIGTVEKVMEMPAHDVYVCRTPDGGEVLIPAIEDVVKKIDLARGEMIVEALPGLFE